MPRKNAIRKWEVKMPPNEWYRKEDPWNIKDNEYEKKKAEIIWTMLDYDDILLDVGCGEGHFTNKYSSKFSLTIACDISNRAIERARKSYQHIAFFPHDIREPIENFKGKIGTIVCSEVLYYFNPTEQKRVAKNIVSLLKPGGKLVVCVSRYFTEKDIKDLFPEIRWTKTYREYDKRLGDDYTLILGGYV